MKQQNEKPPRRIACNELILPQGQHQTLYVLELQGGYVVRQYPLDGEQANTEWLPGTVVLEQDEQGLRAHYQGKVIE